MRRLFYLLWQDDLDPALVEAIRSAVSGAELVLLDTWWGLAKDGEDDPAGPDIPPGAVAVEWSARGPGAAMELCVFGPGVPDDLSPPQFGRRLAKALGRPLLFSDCHVFPLTYMMAREDEAIVHVVVRDDDGMALVPDDPDDPDCWARDVLFEPDAPLPAATAAELDARPDPPLRCAVFGGACPKRKFRCVSVGASAISAPPAAQNQPRRP